jgi:hypothetical protein
MNKNVMGGPMPRPIQDLRDLIKGTSGSESQGAPMASDVETAFKPKIEKREKKKK